MSVDSPSLSAGMAASIAALKAAAQQTQQNVALLTNAATPPEKRAALPYTQTLDKLV